MNLKPPDIPALTALRGIAAIMVAMFHFNAFTAHFVSPDQSLFVGKCYLMVDLFFIISGFIMLHVYGHEFEDTIRKKDFFKFTGARFARIYPLHFFTLMVFVLLAYSTNTALGPVYDPNAIITNIFLLQSYGIHDVNTWNAPSWSISAEWCAYMLFPFLALFLYRFKDKGILLLLIASLFSYSGIIYLLPSTDSSVPFHNLDVTNDYGYLRGVAGFIAGMLTYTAYKKKAIADFFNNDAMIIVFSAAGAVLMHFNANDLMIILLFVPLVLSVAVNKKRLHKFLIQKPLQFIGNISYSIYLTQVLVLLFIIGPILQKSGYDYSGPGSLNVPFFTGLWMCAIFLVLLIIISCFSYFIIEKPCRYWLNKKFKTLAT